MQRGLAAAIVFALTLAVLPAKDASAQGASAGGAQLPPDAEAVTPDGKKAKELLAALPTDDASKKLVASEVKKAKLALGRAHGANLAGDQEGAQLLSRVALAWAQTATATVRTVGTEKKAADAEGRTKELKDKIARARALLAETEARKMQLVPELAKAEEASKKPSTPGKDAAKKDPKKDKPKPEKKPADKPSKTEPTKPDPKKAPPPKDGQPKDPLPKVPQPKGAQP